MKPLVAQLQTKLENQLVRRYLSVGFYKRPVREQIHNLLCTGHDWLIKLPGTQLSFIPWITDLVLTIKLVSLSDLYSHYLCVMPSSLLDGEFQELFNIRISEQEYKTILNDDNIYEQAQLTNEVQELDYQNKELLRDFLKQEGFEWYRGFQEEDNKPNLEESPK